MAERYYRNAVKINPNNIEANFNLGNCFMRKGEFKSAGQWFKKTLIINPSFEAARSNLNKCYSLI